MLYETLEEMDVEETIDEESGAEQEGAMEFAPLLEIGEAERFSDVVARLEGAGIPWFLESSGTVAVLYVTSRYIDEARRLTA